MIWQPIESAPKTGKWVLVWWPRICERPFAAYYSEFDKLWHAAPQGGEWGYVAADPSHWQPLPEPPKGQLCELAKAMRKTEPVEGIE